MPPHSFEATVQPHLDAAFNYARWLTRNDADAEDLVQDAAVRAWRFVATLRGDDARAWFLTIVRNTWYDRFGRANAAATVAFDEARDDRSDGTPDPEARVMQQEASARVQQAIAALPADFREVIVLRELEDLSYKEIAAVVGIPIGTVMSRLARGRDRLQDLLDADAMEGAPT
jgi:RNA polymerase sigma-70 factor (ECF subfamily)